MQHNPQADHEAYQEWTWKRPGGPDHRILIPELRIPDRGTYHIVREPHLYGYADGAFLKLGSADYGRFKLIDPCGDDEPLRKWEELKQINELHLKRCESDFNKLKAALLARFSPTLLDALPKHWSDRGEFVWPTAQWDGGGYYGRNPNNETAALERIKSFVELHRQLVAKAEEELDKLPEVQRRKEAKAKEEEQKKLEAYYLSQRRAAEYQAIVSINI